MVGRGYRFCQTVGYVAEAKSLSMKLLLERLKRNEETTQSALLVTKDLWRKKKKHSVDLGKKESCTAIKTVRKRRVDQMQARYENTHEIRGVTRDSLLTPIQIFRTVAQRVRLLIRVFRNIRQYAIERGGHGNINTGAMQLKDAVVNDNEQKNLLFNPNYFKSKYQFSIPHWTRTTCAKAPEHRKQHEINSVVSLMRQLKAFRKYSNRMQELLAKIVRYERFGRRRVVIRKGHIGMSFYFIFSGSVGVVVEGDEDKAFANEEKPANMLQKGDAFGEIALVRRSVRSATIVCLEKTEFMVIDKDDFYRLGIDKCAQEEMIFRYNFMRNMDLFSTWREEDLKDVAEGGRNIQYLTEQVIEVDTTETEFVYIITKGQCTVLRLLDLTFFNNEEEKRKLKKENLIKYGSKSPALSSGYDGSVSSFSHPYDSSTSQMVLPVYNTSTPSLKQQNSSLVTRKSKQNKTAYENCSLSSFDSLLSNTRKNPNKSRFPDIARKNVMPTVVGKVNNPEKYFEQADIGLGVLIQVDLLESGQAFGMESISHDDEKDDNYRRKFSLVSAGCDVIRIPKSVLKHYADSDMLQKITERSCVYDSDERLYRRFKKYDNWRCFREYLVDHIAMCETKIEKSLQKRCSLVPKTMKLNDVASLGRPETPIAHWQRLAEDGYIIRKSPINSPPRYDISPTNLTEDSKSDSLHDGPFYQKKILTAKSSGRRLVLTHGGSRVNRLQLETKCPLLISNKQMNLQRIVK